MNFVGPLEDRIAIRELLDSYGDAVTRQDTELWASLWLDSEDCKWLLPNMAEWSQFHGKTEIVDEWVKMMTQFHGGPSNPRAISQVIIPGSIHIDGDTAKVRCFSTEFFVDDQGVTRHTKGQYDDLCVKQDGRWLFKERCWTLMALGDATSVQVDKA